MTPRYTDSWRYPHGYTPASATDIRRTFERIQATLAPPAHVAGRGFFDPLSPETWRQHEQK